MLVGDPNDAMVVDQEDADDAEEGMGLLRNLKRGRSTAPTPGAGVTAGFIDPNSVHNQCLGHLASSILTHPAADTVWPQPKHEPAS